jgi:hypothetical protein
MRVLHSERGFWRTIEVTHHEFQCPFCALRTAWHERHVKVLGLGRLTRVGCDCQETARRCSPATKVDPLFGEGPILGPSVTSLLTQER